MNTVLKKMLCWNCDGNVTKETDNCPYCGVYLHGAESDKESSIWSPSYRPTHNQEASVSSPAYQETENVSEEPETTDTPEQVLINKPSINPNLKQAFQHLQKEFFPLIFLMAGSVFFLFGIIILLFSHEGTFTLQWKEDLWIYFIGISLLSGFCGWYFYQKSE